MDVSGPRSGNSRSIARTLADLLPSALGVQGCKRSARPDPVDAPRRSRLPTLLRHRVQFDRCNDQNWDFAVIAYGAAERRLLTKVAVRTFARATSLDDRNWAEGGLLLKFTSRLTLVASIWRPCVGHRAYLLIYDTSRNVSAEDVCNSR